jgi:hypothetical protein
MIPRRILDLGNAGSIVLPLKPKGEEPGAHGGVVIAVFVDSVQTFLVRTLELTAHDAVICLRDIPPHGIIDVAPPIHELVGRLMLNELPMLPVNRVSVEPLKSRGATRKRFSAVEPGRFVKPNTKNPEVAMRRLSWMSRCLVRS